MTPELTLGITGSIVLLVVLFEMMRRYQLREKYAVFWATVALLTLTVTIFPSLLRWAAALVGVEVPVNLLFFVAVMVLVIVGIQHSYELGRLEERTRTLAEEVALLRMRLEGADQPGQHSPDRPHDRPLAAPARPDEDEA